MPRLRVDIWSDIVCPWCYIGKRRFETALENFEAKRQVQVVWHSFELNPRGPWESDPGRYAARLAEKYRLSIPEAESRIAEVAAVARAEGLTFDYSRIRTGRTFDAHRLLHLGLDHGIQDSVKERLFRGYFCEGKEIANHSALLELATDAGLEATDVRKVLDGDAYAEQVRDDENLANELGIHGVPFFVLDGKYAVSGAQPPDVLFSALTRARLDLASPDAPSEGAVCGADGCDAATANS